MDDKIRKSCPNCCQLYHIKHHSHCLKGNLPLFLTCGHTICENCVRSLSKFQEPIECKVCLRCMELKPAEILTIAQDSVTLYEMFPVNYLLLGELTLQLMTNVNKRSEKSPEECFIDIQAIMKQEPDTKDKCVECHILTYKMCKQCDTILCETCFNKSHKNFVIFKNHALQKIAITPETKNNCKTHDDKQLDYYCTDCSKAICMDCLLVGNDKSCKEHNLKSTSDINDSHMEEIINIQPKVDEIFRRLSKTAVDIGHLLYNIETETGPKSEATQIISKIEQHFSKLCSIVQKHKQTTIEIVTKVKSAERESLAKAKDDVYEALKKAKHIQKMISSVADSTMFKQMNLSLLLEDAKKVTETPWYLMKEEDQNNTIEMKVNEDLNELIRDFIHLEGNATSVYKLRTPEELGEDVEIPPPPNAPVFPPPIPRDVRQLNKAKPAPPPPKPKEDNTKPMTFFKQAPNYRSKSGSVNSLNSLSSDSSKQSYKQSEGYHCVTQVKSYAESQEPKPLYEGSQELIYMSHIVDPHSFYVQRASDQKVVKELLREFRNAVSMPKPLPCHVGEGKIYLAYNKADNLWQRCRVLDVDKTDPSHPRFIVSCFDFGSIESVSANNLRLLPPGRWNTPPPLAIHCSLANCEPAQGAWTNDDAILIQNILDNKQAVINVRRLIQSENGTKLEVDVTTFEGKVSLAHALVFHDRAKMPKPKLRYPFMNTVEEMPRFIVSNMDFRPKSIDEIQITHIVNPDMFFVRKEQHQRDFQKMSEELYQAYSLNGDKDNGKVFLPQIGMACVLNTEKYRNEENQMTLGDSLWARCEVTEIGQRGRIQVLLVDVGSRLFVHWTALRTVQMRFTTLRAMTTECHLAGVTPLNKKWSPKSVILLKHYQNHILEMQVEESRNRGSIGVTLFDKTDEENVVCINNEMVRNKYAITFGMFNFNRNPDLEDQAYTYKTPLDRPVQKPKPNKITILKKDSPKKFKEEEDLAAKDKGPLRLEAKVLHYVSPSIIYVSLVHQQKMFNEMFENLQKFYCHEEGCRRAEWNAGDRCCTICIETQTWRRAAILGLDGEYAKVFYSDFATVETVPTSGLKELVPEFLSIGIAAIKCHLCGVMPAIGDEWPSITKEFLKELLDAYQRLFITKLGHFKDNSMPIEIWVYHTIPGSALEADKSEWRCLNKKIIEQGLGIPIKSEQIDVESNEENAEDKEEFLSFLNLTGSVRDWLQLEHMPTKPLLSGAKTETESVSGSSTAVEYDESNEPEAIDFKMHRDIFISEWLPPEPFRNNEFTACATFVNNSGVLFVHDVEQLGTFHIIRSALAERYRRPDPRAQYSSWAVGEPCVALYHYDNCFYRGRVLDVNVAGGSCLVHYVDYGNEEICAYGNMRKGIALHQIPVQAHRCVFARIQPVGTQWETQTLDYVHKLIVEKHCYVKIAGKTVNGITPIDMKYDKLWINDHLVDFDLARYAEGCRPIERRYAPSGSGPCLRDSALPAVCDSKPDCIVDDEPEYIVEDTDENSSFKSVESEREELENEGSAVNPLKGKDWNIIVAEDNDGETDDEEDERPIMYRYPKQSRLEFQCNILTINDMEIFQLNVIRDAESVLVYEELFDHVQRYGGANPPISGIYRHKACIALFSEDQNWYRALILEQSEARGLVKVRFVDYGNVELVSAADLRETAAGWVAAPPLTVAATLHGLGIAPNVDVNLARDKFSEVLMDSGPFDAKIIDYSDFLPTVELRDKNKESIADKLVESGVFVRKAKE